MKTPRIEYPFEIRPLSKEEGGGYVITFPDLPGCRSDGGAPEKTIRNGGDALASWLAVAAEFGDKIPGPFGAVSGRFVQRLPRSLHAQLIARANVDLHNAVKRRSQRTASNSGSTFQQGT